ncbi:hypothetical protein LIA77_03401 [Sarocladium implicatum]|nr:hypothetical protein LIA77_03401 [Sarocladium implicatum]
MRWVATVSVSVLASGVPLCTARLGEDILSQAKLQVPFSHYLRHRTLLRTVVATLDVKLSTIRQPSFLDRSHTLCQTHNSSCHMATGVICSQTPTDERPDLTAAYRPLNAA